MQWLIQAWCFLWYIRLLMVWSSTLAIISNKMKAIPNKYVIHMRMESAGLFTSMRAWIPSGTCFFFCFIWHAHSNALLTNNRNLLYAFYIYSFHLLAEFVGWPVVVLHNCNICVLNWKTFIEIFTKFILSCYKFPLL